MTNNKNLKDLIETVKAPDYWRPSLGIGRVQISLTLNL